MWGKNWSGIFIDKEIYIFIYIYIYKHYEFSLSIQLWNHTHESKHEESTPWEKEKKGKKKKKEPGSTEKQSTAVFSCVAPRSPLPLCSPVEVPRACTEYATVERLTGQWTVSDRSWLKKQQQHKRNTHTSTRTDGFSEEHEHLKSSTSFYQQKKTLHLFFFSTQDEVGDVTTPPGLSAVKPYADDATLP